MAEYEEKIKIKKQLLTIFYLTGILCTKNLQKKIRNGKSFIWYDVKKKHIYLRKYFSYSPPSLCNAVYLINYIKSNLLKARPLQPKRLFKAFM